MAADRSPVILEVINSRQEISVRHLDIGNLSESDYEADLPSNLGLTPFRPRLRPIIGMVQADSVAERAGLRSGDEFLAIHGKAMRAWGEVSALIRQSPGIALDIELRRDGQVVRLTATPSSVEEGGQSIGRIGIQVRDDPALRQAMLITVRYGAAAALAKASAQTWDTSIFSLRMIGRMIAGQVSWKNLSGPVTIADYAGQSARLGWSYYLKFLALISISLGVLNLLPIPILDGGHLLYYIAEIIKGGPLSERIMEIGQQIGLFLLVMLMAFAFYNDINRLVSG
ncbi:MAG: RIP metalloprotease RseP [Sterolibacterium sp.]